jgi:hypothetical protein
MGSLLISKMNFALSLAYPLVGVVLSHIAEKIDSLFVGRLLATPIDHIGIHLEPLLGHFHNPKQHYSMIL